MTKEWLYIKCQKVFEKLYFFPLLRNIFQFAYSSISIQVKYVTVVNDKNLNLNCNNKSTLNILV